MSWTVYLARCGDGSLYTGITRDPVRRLRAHNAGRGAAYTRARRPVTLVYREPAPDRSTALRREWAIRRLSRAEKEALVMAHRIEGGSPPRTAGFAAFRPAALRFFRHLKRHNTRPWFEANRAIWESEVRNPLRALIEELDVRLARLAPEIAGDPKRSAFRLHRDVRFSRDKSPFKTHAACWFYHLDAGRGVGSETAGGAGFYFHLEPGASLVGAGLWRPPAPSLRRVRDALAENLRGFEAIMRNPGFRRRYGGLDPEHQLTKSPRGYPADHPAGRWLRYQSFTAGRALADREVMSPRLPALLEREFTALLPLVRWLNAALGFTAMARRPGAGR